MKKEHFKEAVLSVVVKDEEIGTDPEIGLDLILLSEHIKPNDPEKTITVTLMRRGKFTGTVKLRINLSETRSGMYELKVTVVQASHLRKHRETDVATDSSTMFYVTLSCFHVFCR